MFIPPPSLPPPTKSKMLIKGSNAGFRYSSSKKQGKDHLQLLHYKAITFCQIINCVVKQHSRKAETDRNICLCACMNSVKILLSLVYPFTLCLMLQIPTLWDYPGYNLTQLASYSGDCNVWLCILMSGGSTERRSLKIVQHWLNFLPVVGS